MRISSPGPASVLTIVELPEPVPGPGQVLVEVHYAGVNFADIKRRRGQVPGGTAGGATVHDSVPGIEIAGLVRALGDGCSDLRVGDRVVALLDSGGYAELAVASAGATFRVLDSISWRQAAAFPVVAMTADLGLTQAGRAAPGESVVVTAAAGGVGSTAVQVAGRLGCRQVIGAAGSAGRAEVARRLGADVVVDYATHDLTDAILDATSGRGVDIVLDAVGSSVRTACLAALAPFGRLVHYGNASDAPEDFPAAAEQRESLIATAGFSLRRCRLTRPDLLRSSAEKVMSWAASGRLSVEVHDVLPLADAAKAHSLLESRQVTGKLLLATPNAGKETS